MDCVESSESQNVSTNMLWIKLYKRNSLSWKQASWLVSPPIICHPPVSEASREVANFLAGNNYPDLLHSKGGMKFATQISPLLNWLSHFCGLPDTAEVLVGISYSSIWIDSGSIVRDSAYVFIQHITPLDWLHSS